MIGAYHFLFPWTLWNCSFKPYRYMYVETNKKIGQTMYHGPEFDSSKRSQWHCQSDLNFKSICEVSIDLSQSVNKHDTLILCMTQIIITAAFICYS